MRVAQIVRACREGDPGSFECGAARPSAGTSRAGCDRRCPPSGVCGESPSRPPGAAPGRWRRRPCSRCSGTCPRCSRSSCRAGTGIPAEFGLVKPRAARSGTARSRVAGESCGGIAKIRSSGPRPASVMWVPIFATSWVLSLRRRYSLSLGYSLTRNRSPSRVEFRVDLDDRAADGQHAGNAVEVSHAQLGQFSPAQAGLDIGLDSSFSAASGMAV